ncbi:MAG: ATP-grasp domain-containing protein [Bryobacterales bacterium]|nr:ATP-grasp domain-containing protein [Bryobacterales bacterium]
MAPFQPRLSKEANYPFADDRIVSAVSNKTELALLAEQCGVAAPRTLPAESVDALDPMSQLRFPVICKPNRSCDSNGLGVAATPDALRRAISKKAGFVVQEYVDGPLIVWNGVYRSSRLHAVFTFEAVRTSPAFCGVSVMRRSIHLPQLDRLAERLLAFIGYEGFCSLDFMRDRCSGDYFLIDFNPRFPSSLHASLDAGISFPCVLLCLTLGRPCPPCDYRDGITSLSVSGHIHRLFRRRPGGPGVPTLLGETLTALRWIHRSEESYLLRPFPFAGPFFSLIESVRPQAKRLADQALGL